MEIRSAIIETIAETLCVPKESISDNSKLVDIAPDSIALFELIIRFEQMLGNRIKYEEIAHIETVGDIVAYAQTLPREPIISVFLAAASKERT